jgi:hypothetical protein
MRLQHRSSMITLRRGIKWTLSAVRPASNYRCCRTSHNLNPHVVMGESSSYCIGSNVIRSSTTTSSYSFLLFSVTKSHDPMRVAQVNHPHHSRTAFRILSVYEYTLLAPFLDFFGGRQERHGSGSSASCITYKESSHTNWRRKHETYRYGLI